MSRQKPDEEAPADSDEDQDKSEEEEAPGPTHGTRKGVVYTLTNAWAAGITLAPVSLESTINVCTPVHLRASNKVGVNMVSTGADTDYRLH